MAIRFPTMGRSATQLANEIVEHLVIDSSNAMLDSLNDAVAHYVGPDFPLASDSIQSLVDNLRIEPLQTALGTHGNVNTEGGMEALRLLADKQGSAEAFREHSKANREPVAQTTQDTLSDLPPTALRNTVNTSIGDLVEDRVGEEAAQAIRRSTRRLDRSRVSKEPHEWRYCRDSDAINQIYDIAGEEKPDTLNNSFAAWVASDCMRKAVQRVRLLNRCVRSKNVGKLAGLLEISDAELLFVFANGQEDQVDLSTQCAEAVQQFDPMNTAANEAAAANHQTATGSSGN